MPASDAPWELDDEPAAEASAGRGGDPRLRAILEGLTEPQAEAVRHTEGPLLILAAAGSGKTRVVTRRIAWLIAHGVPPWSILALTFTNKAAGEMKHRAEGLLSSLNLSARGLTVTTFHTLCARLLRRYATAVPIAAGGQAPPGTTGLSPQFTIYDSDDQMAAVKKALNELELSTTNWPPRSVLSAISNAKNELQSASDYASSAKDFYTKNIARAYSLYERDLRRAGAVDFDDLLLLTARLLELRPEVRRQCVDRWQYLMIDEYQDTNRAQFQIASRLAGVGLAGVGLEGQGAGPEERRANVCVVGDPDQAIYGWRGADISNILDFEKSFAGCRVIMLGENFRSTVPILGAADALIQKNKKRKHKPLFTKRSGGKKVQMVLTRDEHHEAQLVADWFQAMRSGEAWDESTQSPRPNWRDMAVFYRTNALSRVVEDAMRRAQIPYVVARGTSFFQREEIKNALGYLRVVANEADDVSLSRIINTPTRGIGDKAQAALEAHAAASGQPLMQSLRQAARIGELSSVARGSVQKFLETIDGWTGHGTFMGDANGGSGGESAGGSLRELVERIVRESGLEKFYRDRAKAAKSDADEERLDNLSELISSAAEFELEYDISADPANAASETAPPPLLAMLRAYLESVALVSDADRVDPEQGAVTLMTLHASKGLEFAAVAVIGLEEGTLPHSRANESDASLEEERRLCFVGMTRAMRQLLLSCARYRTNRGIPERTVPSRFLSELSKEHVAVSDQAGEGWNGGGDRGGVRYERDEFDQTVAEPRRAADAAGWGGGGEGAGGAFKVGTRVRHPQFGLGEVLSITGGLNARAQIRFRDAGVKTLLLQYARLTPVK